MGCIAEELSTMRSRAGAGKSKFCARNCKNGEKKFGARHSPPHPTVSRGHGEGRKIAKFKPKWTKTGPGKRWIIARKRRWHS
jgi:hypothetical protein